ncbi:MAG: cytochrome c biogenesis protein ResB [Ruminococcaceae bacterium]|nr:cytochrome c biogenesis protein ResB [Oscillospiraceae bacterium]
MKYYKISCLIMAVLSAIIFFTSLFYALSGENLFKTPLTAVLLVVFGVLTLVCVCISTVGGGVIYKIGFYVLHGGLVLLIIGFLIYGALGDKYNVSVYADGKYYNSIMDTTKGEDKLVELGFYFRLDGVQTEYHLGDDGKPTSAPKMYTATLTVLNSGGEDPTTMEVEVNKPVYVNGYKIYLMSMDNSQQGATFLFKRDPAEFTITTGIVCVIVGSFLMCYLADVRRKRSTGGDGQ